MSDESMVDWNLTRDAAEAWVRLGRPEDVADHIVGLSRGREADRQRITALETAARAVITFMCEDTYGPYLNSSDTLDMLRAMAALRSVLAAGHTTPDAQ